MSTEEVLILLAVITLLWYCLNKWCGAKDTEESKEAYRERMEREFEDNLK